MRDDGSVSGTQARSRRPALVLAALVGLAFLPLLAGFNVLPFEKYPNWGTAAANNAGRTFEPDRAFQARKAAVPWVVDSDFVGLSVFWPQDLLVARSLREGRLPLWDPTRGGGYPTFDNGQFRPFNPFRVPFFAFPSNWMYSVTLLMGLLFGAWGAFVWLEREGYESSEALVGAGVFALNPWVLERLPIQEPAAYFFLPWVLLALQAERIGAARAALLTTLVLVAMAHSGQPEPCLLVVAIASGHYLFRGAFGGGSWSGLGRRVAVLAGVGLCTLTALAVLWVPLFRLSALSFTYKKAGLPFILESSWLAPFTPAADLFVAPGFVGLLAAALVSRRRVPAYWMGVMLLGLFALMPLPWGGSGLKAALQLDIFVIPLANFKLLFWTGLSFALPRGFQALRTRVGGATVAAMTASAGTLAIMGIWMAKVPLALGDQARFPLIALAILMAGLVALAAGAFCRKWDAGGCVRAGLLILPLAFPLALDHLAWNSIPREESDLVQWLRRDRPHERVLSSGLPFVLPPDSGQVSGVRCGEMNAAYFPNDYFHLFFQPPAPPTLIAFRAPEPLRFKQMGASLVLVPHGQTLRDLPVAKVGAWGSAYGLPEAHGRLFFAERAVSRQVGGNVAKQILELGEGSDGVAVVETMGQPAPASWPQMAPGEGRLSFLEDGTETVTVQADASQAALLVLRDTWYPGWRATVDGAETPIYRVNGCFRGVSVPQGRHRVNFNYRPGIVYWTGAVSLAVTGLLLIAAIRFRTRPRAVSTML